MNRGTFLTPEQWVKSRARKRLGFTPRPGQVWRDVRAERDSRFPERRSVRVLSVGEQRDSEVLVENVTTGRKTTIRAGRFRSNSSGYRLVDPGLAEGKVGPLGLTELVSCFGVASASSSGDSEGLAQVRLQLGNGGSIHMETALLARMQAFYTKKER